MKDAERFWLAAALAPLSVPALSVTKTLYSGFIFDVDEFYFIYLAIGAAFSYVGFLVIGLPFVLWLRLKGNLTYVALLLGGVVAGPLSMIFMQVLSGEPVTFHEVYAQVAIAFTVLTVTVAIVFGLIANARIS
jgi:hypothetical protein